MSRRHPIYGFMKTLYQLDLITWEQWWDMTDMVDMVDAKYKSEVTNDSISHR